MSSLLLALSPAILVSSYTRWRSQNQHHYLHWITVIVLGIYVASYLQARLAILLPSATVALMIVASSTLVCAGFSLASVLLSGGCIETQGKLLGV